MCSDTWKVAFSVKAGKQAKHLKFERPKIFALLVTLAKEIEVSGPIRKNWSNFGPLHKQRGIPENSYRCHLNDGRPTFVVCWRREDTSIKIIEVYYVGTHKSAPYAEAICFSAYP
jgi:hypothetical protein